jgi:hypothetical protein
MADLTSILTPSPPPGDRRHLRVRIRRFVLTSATVGGALAEMLPQHPGVAAVSSIVVAVILEVVPRRG